MCDKIMANQGDANYLLQLWEKGGTKVKEWALKGKYKSSVDD
jgi:hypothetical protein